MYSSIIILTPASLQPGIWKGCRKGIGGLDTGVTLLWTNIPSRGGGGGEIPLTNWYYSNQKKIQMVVWDNWLAEWMKELIYLSVNGI